MRRTGRNKTIALFGSTALALALLGTPAVTHAQDDEDNALMDVGEAIQDVGRAWDDATDETEETYRYYENQFDDDYDYRYDDDYYEDRADAYEEYYDEREDAYEDAYDEWEDEYDETFFRNRASDLQRENREAYQRADRSIDERHQEGHEELWNQYRQSGTDADRQQVHRAHQDFHEELWDEQRNINRNYQDRQRAIQGIGNYGDSYDYYSDDWYDDDRDFDSWYDEM